MINKRCTKPDIERLLNRASCWQEGFKMTTVRPKPSEQTEIMFGNEKGLIRDKKNIAVVHPLVVNSKQNDTTDSSYYSSSESTTSVNFKDPRLADLLSENGPLVVKISYMLNRRNNRAICNWQHLAQAIGVPPEIGLSFDCDSEHSPTEDLFDYLNTWKPDMTFAQLNTLLRAAGRNDLIQILQREHYEDHWKISDNMEFVDLFKDKLDIPKRYMDWRSLASKCGISKKDFDRFGKPKLGPTKQLFLHVRISHSFENLTIEKLKSYFKEMDRYDVLKVFERHKTHDSTLVKDVLKPEASIMYDLSNLLDKDGPVKNWKNLAYKMGIADVVYEDFDTSRVNNRNPTDLLLQWIFANKPEFTVGMMIKSLQSINRNDVVVELRKGFLQALKEKTLYASESREENDCAAKHSSQGYTANLDAAGTKRSSQGYTANLDAAGTKLSQNLDHLSQSQRIALQVTQLPQPLYKKVCEMLDTTEDFYRDYRMLAEELGMEKTEINSIGQRGYPTHNIVLKYRLSVEMFLKIVTIIGREDVAKDVELWLEESPSD